MAWIGGTKSISVSVLILVILLSGMHAGAGTNESGPLDCATEWTPCSAEQGTNSGTLTAANLHQYWTFTPPEGPTVLRIHLTSPSNVMVYLYAPDDRMRDAYPIAWFGPTDVEFDAVADPEGEWRLEIERRPQDNPPVVPYSFTLGYTHHDHLSTFEVDDAQARALSGTLPPDVYSRVELAHGTPDKWTTGSEATVTFAYQRVMQGGATHVSISTSTWVIIPGDREITTWGPVPMGVELTVPGALAEAAETRPFGIESEGGEALEFESGFTHSHGLERMTGWIVWDGDEKPVVDQIPGSEAFFHRMNDFEGEEPGVHAGPIIATDELEKQEEVPDQLNFIHVDASPTSPSSLSPTRSFTMEAPDGTTHEISGGYEEWFYADPGTWRLVADPMLGSEEDIIRFWGVSLPFDDPWGWG